ncbi:MAG: AraC family transcriptional regulator [Colwellia sp.]|nr:AraC family transcriptional regulator [Colwellia sp.]
MTISYQERICRVLNYIDEHLDENLSVDKLAEVACISKFHFHRQFFALLAMNASAYITKLRMRRASYQLAFRSESKVIDVALDNGYESVEAFSRAFKRSTKQSPSYFKKSPDCFPWHENNNPLKMLRKFRMQNNNEQLEVNIKNIEAIRIAVLEHRGAPEFLGHSIRKFIAWRKENKLPPSISRTFNLVYDDPTMVTTDLYRFDLCAEINGEVQENDYEITSKFIPSGRCAVIRHIGADEDMANTIHYLYGDWLKQSHEELRDFPLFFERVSFFPDIPEHKMITDIYLPIK